MTRDLAMLYKEQSNGNGQNFGKRKALTIEKCFNCKKLDHYRKNCNQLDTQLLLANKPDNKKPRHNNSSTQPQQSRNRNRAHIAATDNNNFDPKPF